MQKHLCKRKILENKLEEVENSSKKQSTGKQRDIKIQREVQKMVA